jgi:hypothetical protein
MRYTYKNAPRSSVHDLDRGGAEIERVQWIDTRTGTVCVYEYPWRVTPDGKRAVTHRHVFERVWPIFAGKTTPVMFQCHGRVSRRRP